MMRRILAFALSFALFAGAAFPAFSAKADETETTPTERVTEPATAPTTEPTTEPSTAPVTEPSTEPSTEPVTEPSTAPTTEPVTEPPTEPGTEPATVPATEPSTEPSTETTEATTGPAEGAGRPGKINAKSVTTFAKPDLKAESITWGKLGVLDMTDRPVWVIGEAVDLNGGLWYQLAPETLLLIYSNWGEKPWIQAEFVTLEEAPQETEPLETEPTINPEDLPKVDVQTRLDGRSVTVYGAPEGAELRAEAIHMPSLLSDEGGRGVSVLFDRSYDLKLYLGEEEYQPSDGPVTVSIDGFSQSDLDRDEFVVTHYLDTEDAVAQAVANGRAFQFTVEGLSELYPRETEAAQAVTGRADTICYTSMTRRNGGITCEDGTITFQVDSFSNFNIKQYRLLHGQPIIPNIESDKPEDRMVLNKFVSEEEDGTFSLYLESYATGFMKAKPTEIVLVVDHSGSMYSALDKSQIWNYTEFMAKHPSGSGNETKPGYYACMTKNSQEGTDEATGEPHQPYAMALVWWDGSKWVRSQQVEIAEKNYQGRENGFTFPDRDINGNLIANLDGYNYNDDNYAIYFKTIAGANMDAMDAFLTEIEGLPDCKVAVTGFASPKHKIENAVTDPFNDGSKYGEIWEGPDFTPTKTNYPRRMGGTGVYINGNLKVDGKNNVSLTKSDFAQAFLKADDSDEFNILRQTVKNIQTSYWNTVTSAGLLYADEIFKASSGAAAPGKDDETSRIVVMFTDGKPDTTNEGSNDSTGAGAIAAADTVKSYGAEVYVFGPASLNDGGQVRDLMYNISSYKPTQDPKYVGLAGSDADLKKFFADLGQKIVYDNFLMGSNTVLKDVISDNFTLNENAAEGIEAWSVPVIRDTTAGSPTRGKIIFNNNPESWTKLDDKNISVNGKIVQVTGFDYRENLIPAGQDEADYTGQPTGAKLVVKVPIRVDDSYTGTGKDVVTNGADSGIYDGDGKLVNNFQEPKVDLNTTVTVKKTVVGKNTGDAFGFVAEFKKVDHYENQGEGPEGSAGKLLSSAVRTEHKNSWGGNELDAETTDSKSEFKLKNGGQYDLTRVSVGDTLIIWETDNPLYDTTVKVNGNATDFGDEGKLAVTVTPYMEIEFVNTSRLADLTIVKRVDGKLDENQTFLFHVQGQDKNNKHINMTVTAQGADTVVVKDLPVGNYKITEDSGWSWRYEVQSMKAAEKSTKVDTIEAELTVDGLEVTCTNKRTEKKWLDGSSYCKNIFGPDGFERQ